MSSGAGLSEPVFGRCGHSSASAALCALFAAGGILFFARSSQRLHDWFVGTQLYKMNLESYVNGRGMTRGAKLRILTTVTVVMAIVWVCHLLYFLFGPNHSGRGEGTLRS